MNSIHLSYLDAIQKMISKSEDAIQKFQLGSSQYSLLTNRISALQVALRLVHNESVDFYDKQQALAPLQSIVSKSSKAITKLKEGSWQHTMLKQNIEALTYVLSLIQ